MKRLFVIAWLILAAGLTAHAQWVQTNGPQGAMVWSVVADGSKIIAAAGFDIYHNTGDRWSRVGSIGQMNGGMEGESMLLSGNVLMASVPKGIHRSTDEGKTWTMVGERGALLGHGGTFYAVRSGVISKSTDGLNWTQTGTVPSDYFSGSPIPVFLGGSMYASKGIESQLVRSNDEGATWDTITTNLPAAGWGSRVMGTGKDAIYATGGNFQGLFKSTDGVTWTDITYDMPAANIIRIKQIGDDLWIHTSEGTFRLAGSSWTLLPVQGVHAMAVVNGELIVGTRNGAVKVDADENRVTFFNDGLVASQVGAVGAAGDVVVAHSQDAIHRTFDGGATWERTQELPWVWQFIEHRGLLFSTGDGVHRSTNQGETWTQIGPIDVYTEEGFIRDDLHGLAAHGNDVFIAAGRVNNIEGGNSWSSGGVVRSPNLGQSWQEVNNGLPAICDIPVPCSNILAGEGYVLVTSLAGVFRSTNRGDLWVPANDGIVYEKSYTADGDLFRAGGKIFFYNQDGLFETTNEGVSWAPANPPIPDGFRIGQRSTVGSQQYMWLDKYSFNDTTSTYRLYVFDGYNWKDITGTLPQGVSFWTFTESKGTLYAGSNGQGVWKTGDHSIMQAAGVGGRTERKSTASFSAYPNPAARYTMADFTLTERSHVTISVMNALGEQVAVAFDGEIEAGHHQQKVDVDGLAAGVYMIRLDRDGASGIVSFVKTN